MPKQSHAKKVELAENPDQPLMIYDEPIVMVGGGVVDTQQLKPFVDKFPLIAVDRGAIILADMGVRPAMLVGDFDSVHTLALDNIAHQIKITDQYSTDFQKALAVVHAPKIYGFGFLGKRIDHSLAVLHTLAEYHKKTIILVDPHDIAVMAVGQFQAMLPQGIRVSIWPMHPQRFTASKGLVWPLDGLTIGVGKTLGTSNQVVMPDDEQSGDINVIITSEESKPFAVMMAPEGLSAFTD